MYTQKEEKKTLKLKILEKVNYEIMQGEENEHKQNKIYH